ncbi:hypothetical protein QQ045_027907 [Rhodiola kirilowii]
MKKFSTCLILFLSVIILFCESSSLAKPSLPAFKKCLKSVDPKLIYTPGSPNFSSVLNSYVRNLRYATPATPKPKVIVTPTAYAHVQQVVLCAKQTSFQLRIRSGGHDYEGLSYVSQVPFVLLDLNLLRDIKIDIASETATVQAGATIGELYYKIAQASDVHAFPAGSCTTLGAGGHFTGGGYGALSRKYGLSIDNIVDATIVDVNGKILDRKAMGEDLFWAIRGGGAASFGVVLNWKIKLVRVPKKLALFAVSKTLEQGATDVVDKWQQLTAQDKFNKDLFIRVTFAPQVNTVNATFTGSFLGDSKTALDYVNKVFPELGLKQENIKEGSWVNSTIFWAGSLGPITPTMETLLNRTPAFTIFMKQHSDYMKTTIPKAGLELLWKKIIQLGPLTNVAFSPYGGTLNEIGESDTPFPHRAGTHYKLQYVSFWRDAGKGDKFMQAVDDIYKFFTPYVSSSPRETYLNYRDLDIGVNNGSSSKDFGYKYFKKNFDRLIKIKSVVDPGNFFHFEQSIPTQ